MPDPNIDSGSVDLYIPVADRPLWKKAAALARRRKTGLNRIACAAMREYMERQ